MFVNDHYHDSDRTGDRHDVGPVHSPVTLIWHTRLEQENAHNHHDHANAMKNNPTMTAPGMATPAMTNLAMAMV